MIGLLSWAETLGFEIVCAGKAAELDFVFDPISNRMTRGNQTATIPYYMTAGNRINCTVEKNSLLTYKMIDHDSDSYLWKLRREQDSLFGMTDCK